MNLQCQPPMETISIKCQILFSEKNKKNIIIIIIIIIIPFLASIMIFSKVANQTYGLNNNTIFTKLEAQVGQKSLPWIRLLMICYIV